MTTWHAFLSYSRKQYYAAEMMTLLLQKLEMSIWFDTQQLEPGTNWRDDIQDGLTRSDAVIVLASRASLKSDYVRLEWEHAVENDKPVIVAMIEYVRLPDELKDAPVIDCRADFNAGVVAVREKLLNPQPQRDRISPFPRFEPGVSRMLTAFFLADFAPIASRLLFLVIWSLLFQQTDFITQAFIASDMPFGDRPDFLIWLYWGGMIAIVFWIIYHIGNSFLVRGWRPGSAAVFDDLREGNKTDNLDAGLLGLLTLSVLFSGQSQMTFDELINQITGSSVFVPIILMAIAFVCIRLLRFLALYMMPSIPNTDILRWMPFSDFADEWRTKIYPLIFPRVNLARDVVSATGDKFYIAALDRQFNTRGTLSRIITSYGGQTTTSQKAADYTLLVLSHATSKQEVLDLIDGDDSSIIVLIASRFNMPEELQRLRSLQFVDFTGDNREDSFGAALRLLMSESDSQRSQLQAQLKPVSLSRADVSESIPPFATCSLLFVILTLLSGAIAIWQQAVLNLSVSFMIGFGLLIVLSILIDFFIRRGRVPLPRLALTLYGLLPVLYIVPVLSQMPRTMTVFDMDAPFFPFVWLPLLMITTAATGYFLILRVFFQRAIGNADALGMPPMSPPLARTGGFIFGWTLITLLLIFQWIAR